MLVLTLGLHPKELLPALSKTFDVADCAIAAMINGTQITDVALAQFEKVFEIASRVKIRLETLFQTLFMDWMVD